MAERAENLPGSADVVIIGGGVNGLSTAFQLARRGVRDVVVLERRQLGAGATGKTGALVRCHYANSPESELTHRSLEIFRNWDERVGRGGCGFEPVGFLQVVRPEDEASLRANVADQQALGIDTRIVSREEVAEIEPELNADDLTFAAFEPGSGYADPNATLHGFSDAARALGVRVYPWTEATGIRVENGRVIGVETAQGAIATEKVLVAAGSWANQLFEPLGIDLGMEPVRTQVVIFRWPHSIDHSRKHRVVIDAINHSWVRPVGDHSTLIGAERSIGGVDPDTLDEGVPAHSVNIARDVLALRFPAFREAIMRGGWAGTYMRSQDGHPIIGDWPEIPGLWMMAGDSGSSFKTAPAIGYCLAEWMTDGSAKLVDLTPFRATRFAEGRLWLDPHSYGDDRQLTVSR
jgi:sarcosine oxidase subunit beta